MDVQLIALIGLVLAAVFLSVRLNTKWLTRPGYRYQAAFSFAAAGLLFFVAGLVGWDLSSSGLWFRGAKWVDGPVWWQLGVGLGLLLLAGLWARRATLRAAQS